MVITKRLLTLAILKSNVHGIDIRTMDGVQPFITMDVGTQILQFD